MQAYSVFAGIKWKLSRGSMPLSLMGEILKTQSKQVADSFNAVLRQQFLNSNEHQNPEAH